MSLKHVENWVNRLGSDTLSDRIRSGIMTPSRLFGYQPSFINPPNVEWSVSCPSF
jgi:hypothetical protein